MHDIIDLEARGIPGVFVATTEFIDLRGRELHDPRIAIPEIGAAPRGGRLDRRPAYVFVVALEVAKRLRR
ncbi:MAG: hypothetical protein NTZ61_06150, partial [Proteobacteria bacterium]|nr:hypothetical protein [Pseudomonadota bacterium]